MNLKIGKYSGVLVVILLLETFSCKAATEARFQQGVEAGRAGQFAEAAQAFRESLAEEPASGTLLNLGLAEWRRGRVGEALWSWEQSAWLNPFDQDARNNLRFAREATQLEAPELTWYETASTWLPPDLWAWIMSGSLWLSVAVVVLPVVLRARKAGWHQSLAALGLCVFLSSLPPNLGVITRGRIGIVLEKKTALRLTPTKEGEVVSSLTAGEPVRKIRRRGDYFLIRTGRDTGWVERRQLDLMSGGLN